MSYRICGVLGYVGEVGSCMYSYIHTPQGLVKLSLMELLTRRGFWILVWAESLGSSAIGLGCYVGYQGCLVTDASVSRRRGEMQGLSS